MLACLICGIFEILKYISGEIKCTYLPELNAASNEHIRTYRPADMLIKKLANNHIANPPPKLPSANRRLSTPSSSPFAPEISRTRSPRLSPRALEIETIYEITFTLG